MLGAMDRARSAASVLAGAQEDTAELSREVWKLLVQVTIDQHRERYESVTAALGLSMPQAQAMLELDPDRPVPMNVLAQCLHNDPSNITGLVDRLEGKGLVERRPHPSDRRVKALVLTDEGRDVRGHLRDMIDEAPPAISQLTHSELRRLRDLLSRLVGASQSGAPGDASDA
jgi:DNA-binding MarR family transcriptional regulator